MFRKFYEFQTSFSEKLSSEPEIFRLHRKHSDFFVQRFINSKILRKRYGNRQENNRPFGPPICLLYYPRINDLHYHFVTRLRF